MLDAINENRRLDLERAWLAANDDSIGLCDPKGLRVAFG
jgi:hypothetical protein